MYTMNIDDLCLNTNFFTLMHDMPFEDRPCDFFTDDEKDKYLTEMFFGNETELFF